MLQRYLADRKAALEEGADGGFTLIELLIVIVVLGILSGIVVFGVSTFRGDATTADCKADVKTVSVASDAWNAKWGDLYQRDAAGALVAPGTVLITPASLAGLNYLKTAPTTTVSIAADGKASATCGTATYTA